jgi:hypothetical protein
MATDCLDGALADGAGAVAAEALSDGPCCLRAAVEHRRDTRLLSDVLDPAPPHEDLRTCRGRLQTAWTARALTLVGITTEGAALSPPPRAASVHGGPHPIGTFPGLAEGITAGLGAVASARQRRAAQHPPWPPGRPSPPAAQAAARQTKRRAQPGVDVSTDRPLGGQRHLSPSERTPWGRILRGLPPWRSLRERMAPVDALGDRGCRTQTALDHCDRRRRRLLRFPPLGETRTKLWAPTWAKALTCLDAKRLPSTSHAVARGNRRYRKRPKPVYRVRPPEPRRARVVLDMWRAAHAEGRQHPLASLHQARAG